MIFYPQLSVAVFSIPFWIKVPGGVGVTHPKNLPSCTKESTTSCVMSSDQNDKCGYLPSWEVTYVPMKSYIEDDFPFPTVGHVSSLEFMLYPEFMDQNGKKNAEQ